MYDSLLVGGDAYSLPERISSNLSDLLLDYVSKFMKIVQDGLNIAILRHELDVFICLFCANFNDFDVTGLQRAILVQKFKGSSVIQPDQALIHGEAFVSMWHLYLCAICIKTCAISLSYGTRAQCLRINLRRF